MRELNGSSAFVSTYLRPFFSTSDPLVIRKEPICTRLTSHRRILAPEYLLGHPLGNNRCAIRLFRCLCRSLFSINSVLSLTVETALLGHLPNGFATDLGKWFAHSKHCSVTEITATG